MTDLESTGEVDTEQDAIDLAREREAMREGVSAAIPSMLKSLAVGAVILLPMVFFMRAALTAAEAALKDGTEVSYEPYMPAILFAMFGGVFGLASGWRMTMTSGLTGRYAWLIGAAGAAALILLGAIAGVLFYSGAIPVMFWVSLAVVAVTALVGMTVFTLWGAG